MKKWCGMLCVVLLMIGSAWSDQAVRVKPFSLAEVHFSAEQLRGGRGLSDELQAIRGDYLQAIAELVNGYYAQVILSGIEPLSLRELSESRDPETYLKQMRAHCDVAMVLAERTIEQGYEALIETQKRLRNESGVPEGLKEELEGVSVWFLLLFDYEGAVVAEKQSVFDVLSQSFGLWSVDGTTIVFEQDDEAYADLLNNHFNCLRKLETVERQWSLRDDLQSLSLHKAADCWRSIEKVLSRY